MEKPVDPTPGESKATEMDADRRDFIQKAGKFALVAPPAITFLLTTSLTSNAIAKSGETSSSSPQVLPRGYDKP